MKQEFAPHGLDCSILELRIAKLFLIGSKTSERKCEFEVVPACSAEIWMSFCSSFSWLNIVVSLSVSGRSFAYWGLQSCLFTMSVFMAAVSFW